MACVVLFLLENRLVRLFSVDRSGMFPLTPTAMKNFVRKIMIVGCLGVVGFVLAVPAQAARTGGSTFFTSPTPKPVKSAF